jgi:FG-GAP-like repeat
MANGSSRDLSPILYCEKNRTRDYIAYGDMDFYTIFNAPRPGKFWLRRILVNDKLNLNIQSNVVICPNWSPTNDSEVQACHKLCESKSDLNERSLCHVNSCNICVSTSLNLNPNQSLFSSEVGTPTKKDKYNQIWEYYYKTLSTVFEHKSPTPEHLYGKELKILRWVVRNFAYAKKTKWSWLTVIDNYSYDWLKFDVDWIRFVLPKSDYIDGGSKIYFTETALISLYGKDILLKNFMWIFSWSSTLLLTGSDKITISVPGEPYTTYGWYTSKYECYAKMAGSSECDNPVTKTDMIQQSVAGSTIKYPRYGGMNMGTSDRPIDSVRYSSFQGIGGDLVKLVYPNLYNVAVFDSAGKLKSEEQIQLAIKEYLTKQAQIYRSQLQAQQDKSQIYYASQKKWFDVLATADKLASPNRTYDLTKIGDDFFIKGLAMKVGTKQFTSDDIIVILARNLYYQNLITPVKESSPILTKELDGLYKNIALDNINSKRKFVFDTYLTYGSDKTSGGVSRLTDRSNLSGMLLPAYDSKWYEIASITSDGSDYHVDPNLNPSLKQFQIASNTAAAAPRHESYKENLAPLICNNKTFDRWWVPVLQYPKAFSCWLEDVKRSSITVTVNGDLVDLIKTWSSSGFKAAATWYFVDQISYVDSWKQFGEQAEQVPGQWKSLLGSAMDTVSNVAKLWDNETYQKRRWNLNTKSGVNQLTNDSLYDSTAMTEADKTLSQIFNNLSIDASANQMSTDGTGTLNLSVLGRTKPYSISISGTWSACIILNNTNTCTQPISLSNRWSWNKSSYQVSLAPWAKLWDAGLLLKICVQGTTTCMTYAQIYTIIPGQIATIKVIDILNGWYLARGSQMPMIIKWYDRENRPLSLAPQPYRVTTDQWSLMYMSQTTKTVDIATWAGLTMLYDSRAVTGSSDRVSIAPLYPEWLLPVLNTTIKFAEPVLRLTTRQWDRTLEQGIDITLPSQPNTLTKPIGSGDTTLVPDKIPMIRLWLEQLAGQQVLGSIRISSQNGLVNVWVIGSQLISGANKTNLTQYIWSDQDSFVITGTSQEIYLYPSYRAGKDIIQVMIGNKVWSIPVVVRAGDPAWVLIKAPERLNQYQTGVIDFAVTDYWGNQLSTDTWLSLTSYGRLFTLLESANPTTSGTWWINGIQTIKWTARITVVPKAIIGKWYITAQIRDLALDKQRSAYAGTLVQSTLWPSKKINSLVLELKGTDWWNTVNYQTSQSIKAPSLITNSSKLVSVVTNLIDSSKLRQSQLIIHPQGAVQGSQAANATLSLVQGTWNIVTSAGMIVPLDKSSSYALTQSATGVLTTKPTTSSSSLYYIPTVQDSVITSNRVIGSTISVNGQTILDLTAGVLHPDVTLTYNDSTDYGAWVYDVMYRGKLIWNLVMHRAWVSILQQIPTMKTNLSDIYGIMTGYVGWSTSSPVGIHIVTRDSSYTQEQASQTPWSSVIIQFGQGKTVGDAAKYYDQFSITYGDAAVSKSTVNTPAYALVDGSNDPLKPLPVTKSLPYDTGIGQIIYHNPDKPIERVTSIDFNKDGLKDLLVIYTDGSVRLLKNYGGKQPWRDLWHLMIIADGIKNLYIGDVDKNWYQDIIVNTQEDKLRVYYNNKWEFDVDGYPVCLDIPGGPDDLSQLYYWTIRDMDNDGGIDITTYDHNGDVKVFYGGRWGSSDWSSYVSRDHGLCDTGWKSRQQSTLVQSFGMNLLTTPIKDDSLIHWSTHVARSNPYSQQPIASSATMQAITNETWLNQLEDTLNPTLSRSDSSSAGVGFNPDTYQAPDKLDKAWIAAISKQVTDSVNVNQVIDTAYVDATRYVPVAETLRPTYQTKWTTLYLPTNKTTTSDPFAASRVFKDLNGWVLTDRDLVQITVKITGTPWVQFAYLDKLTGPWIVPLTDAWWLEWASADFTRLNQWIKYNIDGYIFSINGATMDSDGSIELSYIVQYRSEKIADVEVLPSTPYPIVQASSVDGCQKTQRQYSPSSASKARIYASKTINYNAAIIKEQTDSYKAYDTSTQQQTTELMDSMSKEDGVFDYLKERWNSDNAFQRGQGIMDGTYLQSIPTQFRIGLQSWAKEQETSRKITDFTNKLCNGFKNNSKSCAGTTPPAWIPFNMAFPPLTPGTVNVMGYKVFEDKWLPILAFPTNGPIPIWPPNPAWAWWWLKWAPSSQFRFYATPTLTTAFGFAFCFGPYGVWVKIPAPFKNVVGNCIVLATQPLRKKQQQCSVASNPDYSPPAQPDLPTCYGSLTTDLSKISATQMVTFDVQTQAWLERQRLTSPSDLYYNNTYYGWDAREIYASSHSGVAKAIQLSNSVIHLNSPARVANSSELFSMWASTNGTRIWQIGWQLAWMFVKDDTTRKANVRKIGKWIQKGIGACLMQIADNQIQYTKNNLLTSSLTVILPDLSNLWVTSDRGTIKDNRVDQKTEKQVKKAIEQQQNDTLKQAATNKELYESSVTTNKASESIVSSLGQVELNPFYRIEQLFNDVKLINISHKDIMLQVPYIREAELGMYRSQLGWRRDRNKLISKQWLDYGSWLTLECLQLSDPVKKQECNDLLKQVVYINKQFWQLSRSAQANLTAINQYAHFQSTVLPNRQEQNVIYISELTNVVNSTMSQLAAWSTQNAARFTSWTSAIRSMIVAVKTRQLLIDFSVNWREKCGTCKIDNYDFATCSLNGLCPNFPLFARPNFRTPDFTIDLSNIDAGIDIVVPNFRFTPVNVPLYRLANLPDLPLPPQLGSPAYAQLNVILPTLPVIPGPPTLPTLPSLSMNVEMDLPTLPPAPKIPMLPETLQAAVQVAEFIGKILCIVKWDIWLVWEKFVKQKIEQITARTREVSPFDSISTIISQPRPQWYNARLDAYVNLRFYFDGLYNVFDDLWVQWNNGATDMQRKFATTVMSGSNWVNGNVQDWVSAVQNWAANTLNNILSGANISGTSLPTRLDATIKPLWSAEFDARVVVALNQFGSHVDDTRLADQARHIVWLVQKPIQAQANIQWLEKVHQQAQWILNAELIQAQSDYQQIKYNYDGWLDTLTSDQYVSDNSQTTSLSTSLYTINPEVADVIQSSDITQEYLQGNKELLGRYQVALNGSDAQSLNMDVSDYQQSRDYVDTILAMTDQAIDKRVLLADNGLEELRAERAKQEAERAKQEADGWIVSPWSPSDISSTTSTPKRYDLVWFDQSNQRDGYLINTVVDTPIGKIKAAVDVIKPEWLGTQYRETSFQEDMNDNPKDGADIVLRDSDTIYIKYAVQKDSQGSTHKTTKTIYRLPALTSPSQLDQLTSTTDGYVSCKVNQFIGIRGGCGQNSWTLSRSQRFRLWSRSYAVTNFQLQWQDYDNIILQWLNPDIIGQTKNESYLVKFTTLVDRHPDRLGPESETKYVLVVPAGQTLDPLKAKIRIPWASSDRTIKDLVDRKILHDVVNYDPTQEMIVWLLRNLTRRWNYAQVLRVESLNGVYTRTSPWSNQDVWWYQIAWDKSAPIPEVKLIRKATNKEVWWWMSMQWYINTNYDLVVTWKDNVSIARTSVAGMLQPKADKVVITKIYEQKPKTLKYTFSALDSSNNATTINVTVTIQNPELETISATNTNGARGTVTAKLTPDLDDGVIKFQQQDSASWKNLFGVPGSISWYLVQPLKTLFTGWLYQFPNSRWLKNADWSNVWSISNQGQITTQALQLLVKFPQWYPVISMINASWVVQYELTYAPQTLTGSVPVDIKTPAQYRLLSLQNFNAAIAGSFAQGQCIAPQLGECEVYVSKQWDIWVDPAVRANYYGTYLWRNWHSVYQIMRDKTFVAEVNLVTKEIK